MSASGRLAAILYKEEIERAMKTRGISGFQLLDLHDFPGQGTALVGLLNAFWESKGVANATEFRQFSAPVVPLARFPKAVYKNNELFTASIEVANYSSCLIPLKLRGSNTPVYFAISFKSGYTAYCPISCVMTGTGILSTEAE